MLIVSLIALAVGGATILGGILGFIFKGLSHKAENVILYFASGIMLSAAVIGLIIPSLDAGGRLACPITLIGVFGGAFAVNLLDRIIPDADRLIGGARTLTSAEKREAERAILFVTAIAVHNFPEGLAAGIGFGGDLASAIKIAGSIALQNVPEGMIIIAPLLSSGMSRLRTFTVAAASGAVEVIGTFIGYFAVSAASALLPFALAFAGGTMLYVVSGEMPKETDDTDAHISAYAFLIGFSLMLAIDHYI